MECVFGGIEQDATRACHRAAQAGDASGDGEIVVVHASSPSSLGR
jgi:hypothetical protein